MNVCFRAAIPHCFLLCLCSAILLPATAADASHNRYGHVQWSTGAGENEIDFVIQNAWRRDQGNCIDPNTGNSTPCTGPDGLPGVGDIHNQQFANEIFNFGDGNQIPSSDMLYLVTDIDPENNWYFGTVVDPTKFPEIVTTVSHTYASPGQYTAYFQDCCRISAQSFPNRHINNADANTRIETVVNVSEDGSSAIALVNPIVTCPIDDVCVFEIAFAHEGDSLQFRLADPQEATGGSTFHQPGPPHAPTEAAIDSDTGVYVWDTTDASLGGVDPAEWNVLYSTQVIIEDFDDEGDVKSKVAVDFFIQLVPFVEGDPPECTITPPGPLTIVPGQEVTINVEATDPDGGQVTLNSLGLPGGAVTEPPLPTSSEGTVSATVTWTPSQGQLGNNLIRFGATDAIGLSGTCDMSVQVLDRELWKPLSTGISGTTYAIESFDPDGTNEEIYVAGTINNADGQPVNGIARWDGEAWHDVGGGIGGSFPLINDMIVWNDHLFVTGSFTTAGGTTANNIAKWDGNQWSALGSGLSGTGWALAVYNNELYVGGAFWQAGGNGANRIARWNGSSWSPVGGGVSGGLARVYAMHVHEGDLYVGGRFTSAGGVSANNIARWNGSWSTLEQGVGSSVRAIASFADGPMESGEPPEALYVGGTFTEAGGNPADHLARWDGYAWSDVAGGVSGLGDNTAVLALRTHNDGQGESLFVGGAFTEAGEENAMYLARWDGSAWHPYGVGMNDTVTALGIGHDEIDPQIFAGGSFKSIGGIDANGVVQWLGPAFAILPTNTTCEASELISDGIREFDTTLASTDGLPEPTLCEFDGDAQIHADLWYEYSATCDGMMTVKLCGSTFDTKLGVYTAHCDAESNSILACDAHGCDGEQASVTLPVNAGDTFIFRVGGHQGETGVGTLNVQCEPGILGDLNGDGAVDVLDLIILLGQWGTCPESGYCPADLNDDGVVDTLDLLILINNWG